GVAENLLSYNADGQADIFAESSRAVVVIDPFPILKDLILQISGVIDLWCFGGSVCLWSGPRRRRVATTSGFVLSVHVLIPISPCLNLPHIAIIDVQTDSVNNYNNPTGRLLPRPSFLEKSDVCKVVCRRLDRVVRGGTFGRARKNETWRR